MNNNFLSTLVEKNQFIYCAVRLFSPQDRIAGANLAGALEAKLNEVSPNAWKYVFLPYRDTNQSSILGGDRAEQIYKLDIDKLNNSSALLARFDGLTKDSGISMEIGYAYGNGIPIGVLFTDFMWEGHDSNDTEWKVDPVIELMSNVFVAMPEFGRINSSYYYSNIEHEHCAVHRFVKECLETFPLKKEQSKRSKNKFGVYVDIMGGRYEWSRRMTKYILESLQESFKSGVKSACRYTESNIDSIHENARKDIESINKSSIAIFCGDAPELDAGSAALLGLAKAQGLYIIFQFTSNIIYKGLGGQKMKVNLMLEYSADIVTSSVEETIHAAKCKLLECD